MLQNNFKIAWRNLKRDKGFSIINIIGLTIGLMAATAIALWIQSELTYDRFYSKTDRLYEVFTSDEFQGGKHAWGQTPAILGPTLAAEYPEVEAVVRIANMGNRYVFRVGDNKFTPRGIAPDSSFFSLFDFNFIAGNPTTPLNGPNSVVLTESLAKRLFGKTSVIGQSIALDTVATLVVSAVIEDIPANSRFSDVEYFCPWLFAEKTIRTVSYGSWTGYNHQAYVLLRPGVELQTFNEKIRTFVAAHDTDPTNTAHIFLHPAAKWHLYNKSENGQMVAGRLNTVRLFIVIGVFILLLACINFTNLSTARSEKRAKEVGVRKVVGARRNSLVVQFLTESIFLSVIAGLLAVTLLIPVLPFFSELISRELSLSAIHPVFWLCFALFLLFTGIVAGIYPALFLSSFQPVKTLKGRLGLLRGTFTPRKVLVVLQFTFSVTLISCTLIIVRQIEYVQNRDNGYDKNNLVYAALNGEAGKNYALIKQELLDKGAATAITKTIGPITRHTTNSWNFSWPNSKPEDHDLVFEGLSSDADFVKTMQVALVTGRDIDVYQFPTDSNAVLLNETAVKRMGLKDPLGAELVRNAGKAYEERWHVVGVVKDFINQSPYDAIEPLIVYGPAGYFSYMHIRLNPDRATAENLAIAEAAFHKFNPYYPFEYTFVDEAYGRKFAEEQRIATLTALFAAIAILIACLGLFGLAAFTAQQKTKEIGIRKVLGASIAGIVTLLSKDFIKLVCLAIVIASPIAWWAMHNWLEDFDYRIEVEWWLFVLTGFAALAIALLTVSWQAIRAAVANPVESLRDE
ncbi:ABC transporter permease [Parapedobacter indicus]|uniref:Duplicated orphan permease n=1 Tax=Parapedobacter indicus TaxID=1477437 RepID=A0A1I3HDA5_9SPHI|nr:ABC transporter permease [Parapedobacter indicus]PPL02993.1 putative permease [Parapedobacter indicus]SFI33768.1 duplicated orphan permease [Parapedobacter indicus]